MCFSCVKCSIWHRKIESSKSLNASIDDSTHITLAIGFHCITKQTWLLLHCIEVGCISIAHVFDQLRMLNICNAKLSFDEYHCDAGSFMWTVAGERTWPKSLNGIQLYFFINLVVVEVPPSPIGSSIYFVISTRHQTIRTLTRYVNIRRRRTYIHLNKKKKMRPPQQHSWRDSSTWST